MVVGGQSEMVYLPTTLAQQLGHFHEHGIEVGIDDVGAGSKSLQAVLGGSAHVATGFYDHAIHMAAEGKAIRSFLTLTRYPGAVLLTSPAGSATITTVKDLKGRSVGVTAPGSSSHFFLNYLLVRNGVAPSDVAVVGMGGGRSRAMAVQHSRVDAAVVFEPTVSFLERSTPGVRLLIDTRSREGVRSTFGVDEYPSAALYANASWLEANRELGRSLARALRATLLWIQGHSAVEIARYMPEAFRAEDPEGYVTAIERSKRLYSPDGMMDADAAMAVRTVLGVSIESVRTRKFDLRQTYTNEFLLD
jgi:NitT/TauT family transport system substrate-binding protein